MFTEVCLFPGHLICSRSKDMKQFWLGESPIGQGVLCPRDLRAGCAMVDWIPHVHCRKQTHFMSWTWKYSLSQLQSALRTYEGVHAATFFFMFFFATTSFAFLLKAVLVPLVIWSCVQEEPLAHWSHGCNSGYLSDPHLSETSVDHLWAVHRLLFRHPRDFSDAGSLKRVVATGSVKGLCGDQLHHSGREPGRFRPCWGLETWRWANGERCHPSNGGFPG